MRCRTSRWLIDVVAGAPVLGALAMRHERTCIHCQSHRRDQERLVGDLRRQARQGDVGSDRVLAERIIAVNSGTPYKTLLEHPAHSGNHTKPGPNQGTMPPGVLYGVPELTRRRKLVIVIGAATAAAAAVLAAALMMGNHAPAPRQQVAQAPPSATLSVIDALSPRHAVEASSEFLGDIGRQVVDEQVANLHRQAVDTGQMFLALVPMPKMKSAPGPVTQGP